LGIDAKEIATAERRLIDFLESECCISHFAD